MVKKGKSAKGEAESLDFGQNSVNFGLFLANFGVFKGF
jgi:hypothetical protein